MKVYRSDQIIKNFVDLFWNALRSMLNGILLKNVNTRSNDENNNQVHFSDDKKCLRTVLPHSSAKTNTQYQKTIPQYVV